MSVFFSLVVSKTIPSIGPHTLDRKYTMKLKLTMEVNWGAILRTVYWCLIRRKTKRRRERGKEKSFYSSPWKKGLSGKERID
jgi:hypothetical protein